MQASSDKTSCLNARLEELLELHFHPQWGSAYWLDRQEKLGWNVCDQVRTIDDLWRLGPMPVEELRQNRLRTLVPKWWHRHWQRFVIGETAGTSGKPCVSAYRDDEFQAAFIAPFLRVAKHTGFPLGEPWLWVGPSGPHIIGKVVRELARQTGSMDPFSIDFDPRWAKRLAEGSLARQRYLDHVTDQALDVLRREEVGVLFITPPALAALERELSDNEREAIHGIHYGGMSLTAEEVNHFRAAFPEAVHLSGYGNTLFGVLMETEDTPREALDYYPEEGRLHFQVVEWPATQEGEMPPWPPRVLPRGQMGRVLFHRMDESCLLMNVIERDQAQLVAPNRAAVEVGYKADGLRNPCPASEVKGQIRLGLY
jgi:phenylacetate-coenzyme A ligase PaaK-like adenylate-forming protein